MSGKGKKKKKKVKNRPDMSVSDKQIAEYVQRHQLTPATPQYEATKPWRWKGVESCNIKLHTPEIKLEAFKQYCEHISRGKAKQSWSFEHPDITLTWQTMETYIANDKDGVFNTALIDDAVTRGYRYWEQFVEDATKMAVAHDTNAMAMLMRNKFRWDRPDHTTNDTKAQVHVLVEAMKMAPTKEPTTIDIPNPEIEHKEQEAVTEPENTESEEGQ